MDLGRELTKREWQTLADLLMLARNAPVLIQGGEKTEHDKELFQAARLLAVFYMGHAPEGDTRPSSRSADVFDHQDRIERLERCVYAILEDDGNFRSRVSDEDFEGLTR